MITAVDNWHDVVILGTGLTECVLSGLLGAKKGCKVLHMDRNDHYGGETASVTLKALFQKYGNYNKGEEPWKKYGSEYDWNIDLVPKLLMFNGSLKKMLVSLCGDERLGLYQVAGSYVQQGKGPKATVAKVPSTPGEALRSSLLGIWEKRYARNFLEFVSAYNPEDPATHRVKTLDVNKNTMKEFYEHFGLTANTQEFVGHSMALYQTDDYIDKPGMAKDAFERIILYARSMAAIGKSPYIYPQYGLGVIPETFSRLSALHGGTYMLNADIDEIITAEVDDLRAKEFTELTEVTQGGKQIEKDGDLVYEPVFIARKDSNGQPVYETYQDESGQTKNVELKDHKGKPIPGKYLPEYVAQKDEDGQPMYKRYILKNGKPFEDEDGQPAYYSDHNQVKDYKGEIVKGKVWQVTATRTASVNGKSVPVPVETYCRQIFADPSYFPGKVHVTGYLLKAICILNHPIANTDDSDSLQLIIPQSQIGRKHDIYIALVSSVHHVCPRGYYIAIVSTIAESDSNHHLELQPGFERLGKIEEKFMGPPIPLYASNDSGKDENIYISKSYDATSHFETATDDIQDIWKRAWGEKMVFGVKDRLDTVDLVKLEDGVDSAARALKQTSI